MKRDGAVHEVVLSVARGGGRQRGGQLDGPRGEFMGAAVNLVHAWGGLDVDIRCLFSRRRLSVAGTVGEFVPGGTLLADACTDLFRTCGACAAPVAARLAPLAGSPAVPFSCRAPADAWPAPSLSLAEPSVRRPVTRP